MRRSEIVFPALAFVAFLLCLFFGVIYLVWQDVAIFALCATVIVTAMVLARRS
jgi:hypothetical protein